MGDLPRFNTKHVSTQAPTGTWVHVVPIGYVPTFNETFEPEEARGEQRQIRKYRDNGLDGCQ